MSQRYSSARDVTAQQSAGGGGGGDIRVLYLCGGKNHQRRGFWRGGIPMRCRAASCAKCTPKD